MQVGCRRSTLAALAVDSVRRWSGLPAASAVEAALTVPGHSQYPLIRAMAGSETHGVSSRVSRYWTRLAVFVLLALYESIAGGVETSPSLVATAPDVVGIRPGMDELEALNALKLYAGVADVQVRDVIPWPELSAEWANAANRSARRIFAVRSKKPPETLFILLRTDMVPARVIAVARAVAWPNGKAAPLMDDIEVRLNQKYAPMLRVNFVDEKSEKLWFSPHPCLSSTSGPGATTEAQEARSSLGAAFTSMTGGSKLAQLDDLTDVDVDSLVWRDRVPDACAVGALAGQIDQPVKPVDVGLCLGSLGLWKGCTTPREVFGLFTVAVHKDLIRSWRSDVEAERGKRRMEAEKEAIRQAEEAKRKAQEEQKARLRELPPF